MERENERIVSLFRNGPNQALRIPHDFEMPGTKPGTKVVLRRESATRLVIETIPKRGLDMLLAEWAKDPYTEEIPQIKDPPLEPEDIF